VARILSGIRCAGHAWCLVICGMDTAQIKQDSSMVEPLISYR